MQAFDDAATGKSPEARQTAVGVVALNVVARGTYKMYDSRDDRLWIFWATAMNDLDLWSVRRAVRLGVPMAWSSSARQSELVVAQFLNWRYRDGRDDLAWLLDRVDSDIRRTFSTIKPGKESVWLLSHVIAPVLCLSTTQVGAQVHRQYAPVAKASTLAAIHAIVVAATSSMPVGLFQSLIAWVGVASAARPSCEHSFRSVGRECVLFALEAAVAIRGGAKTARLPEAGKFMEFFANRVPAAVQTAEVVFTMAPAVTRKIKPAILAMSAYPRGVGHLFKGPLASLARVLFLIWARNDQKQSSDCPCLPLEIWWAIADQCAVSMRLQLSRR